MSKNKLCTLVMVGMFCMPAFINVSCSKDSSGGDVDENPTTGENNVETPSTKTYTTYNEQYRPQVHYTPLQNWINDPNGLVYVNGVYHMFFQYNPSGNDWGNMSWGHATSSDLIHWTQQGVAMTHNDWGDIWSGSCVVDKNNTSGFGDGSVVAIYTSAAAYQQISLAYSINGGMTFTQYADNPVIKNNDTNFRDPKVVWCDDHWVACIARGTNHAIDFYGSKDLKSWSKLSTFTTSCDRLNQSNIQWECPDMIEFKDGDKSKWVLVVSVNPGGPKSGSGTAYFTGSFDGTNFTADDRADYPLWLDYGMDNYAGVTWSNTDDRHIMIGWMNNWNYCGAVPCSPWRSAMTLPRELELVDYNGMSYLSSKVVNELDKISGSWSPVTNNVAWNTGDAYQLQITLPTTSAQTITLKNNENDQLDIDLKPSDKLLQVTRNSKSGATTFASNFANVTQAPLFTDASEITLNIYIDRSSVEIVSENGLLSMTTLVYPTSIYNRCTFTDGKVNVRPLSRIWPAN